MDTIAPPETITESNKARFASYDCSTGCPVEGALEQISGKWKGLVVYHLMEGPLRFSELRRRTGNVTQRSLTNQLRELEADGIIDRKVFAVVPPRVDYSLTAKGEQLRPIVMALHAWGSTFPKLRQAGAG